VMMMMMNRCINNLEAHYILCFFVENEKLFVDNNRMEVYIQKRGIVILFG
jgi:hypothetical protein